jgi:hypothetical protein
MRPLACVLLGRVRICSGENVPFNFFDAGNANIRRCSLCAR